MHVCDIFHKKAAVQVFHYPLMKVIAFPYITLLLINEC